ncbi:MULTISPECIES: LysR substrate-binding domain-containing protein [unclassified Marinobacter]|uniref:LysR substrate-binding domain-containing protein n=1 Tax=unclassified Marinobacter TaxID=83889 RepID=UPI001927AE51|nr:MULTISPECIES: LysR substrate-binding domain-containing protein [unclassified Marinobacter]MBL3827192.1 LysR family transcriptional regulator [Marinobacter sp. MC3]MBL3895718.1 LysR family transcriptional regulator [Marinobacter sp. MW3]
MNIDTSKLPLLDTDVLRTFVAIAECGSFTRAAAQVHRTPAALSMQIKRLEETIGKPVFRREPRQVRLTSEGEILLGYSRRLLKLNAEAVQQFLSPSLTGKISFGTTDDIGTRILPGVLAQFARSFPGVQVDVTITSSRENLDRIDSGSLDMGLVIIGNEGQEVRGEIIHTEPLVWAGREGGIAFEQSPLPLALANQGCVWRRTALDALDNAGLAYRVAYTCENTAAQEAAMLADLAITPFPISLIRSPIRRLEREGLPELAKYQISLVRNSSNPETDMLAEHIKSAFLDIKSSAA